MSGRLEGRVAAITGASSGIGRAAAELFVQEGAKVALGDIQDDAGQALADSLGDGAVFARCDVTCRGRGGRHWWTPRWPSSASST